MNDLGTHLAQWFSERPKWLQEAARRHSLNGILDATDCEELIVLCKREAGIIVEGHELLKIEPIGADAFGTSNKNVSLKLNAIGAISGINALAPKSNLEFGHEPLTIVYGANGAGKSGYTRILKHCCGGRGAATLHKNVFDTATTNQTCKLHYTFNGSDHEIEWKPGNGVHQHLRNLCIYDTGAAHVYVNSENEVTYEPAILGCFSILVEVCEYIDGELSKEIAKLASRKPLLPSEYTLTDAGTWFATVSATTTGKLVSENCAWSEDKDTEISTYADRLNETNPIDKAKGLRKTRQHIATLRAAFLAFQNILSESKFAELKSARAEADRKRQTADLDAKKVFEDAPLEGIATESWSLMWEAARKYSETAAYRNMTFPQIDGDSVCVLCQQTLANDGAERLANFEAFVKSDLESQAKAAELKLQLLTKTIQTATLGINIEVSLDLCKIANDANQEEIIALAKALEKRKQSFLTAVNAADLSPALDFPINDILEKLELECENDAKQLDEIAKEDKRPEIQRGLRELKAQKWVSEQTESVVTEITRQQTIVRLEKARKLTNTKALSTKKSTLADDLVTKAFISRFENELAMLGGARIQVTIEKTRGVKGKVWHQIKLKGNSTNIQALEVLSEGEFRIVSLAAFLADVDTTGNTTAFIFDDPISSLDQDFEEATAARIIQLCASRQVIVFTHRLSLLSMLEDAADKAETECRTISVLRESWGAGQPGDPPLPAQKPKVALNTLIDQRLSKAQKAWSDEGAQAYAVHAKALCSDIRITIERLIELELLADVVQRFRRPINTMGKIGKLARIKKEDCDLLDAMMTKYSRYEHAQPKEAPVILPEPTEIKNDLLKLKTWQTEFAGRTV